MKRRYFLQAAAALAALPAVPAVALPAPAAPLAAAPVVVAARAARPPWWGYSAGDGFYHEGGRTAEETAKIARAEGYGGERVEIALCHPKECTMPDAREEIVNWLGDDGTWSLADTLSESFSSHNSDADYEGEVEDESSTFDWDGLERKMMPVIAAALERHGIFISGDIEAGCLCEADEATIVALEKDAILGRDLTAISEAWADEEGARDIGRSIDITDEQKLYVPNPLPKLAEYRSVRDANSLPWPSPGFSDRPTW